MYMLANRAYTYTHAHRRGGESTRNIRRILRKVDAGAEAVASGGAPGIERRVYTLTQAAGGQQAGAVEEGPLS